jgi:hypothetical protein
MSQGGVNDNPDDVGPGESVNFPNPPVNPFGIIQRKEGTSPNEFTLPPDCIFEITFQVTTDNTGELIVVLNGNELVQTVVGMSGGGSLVGMSIITTPSGSESILSINNPVGSPPGGLKIDESSGSLAQPLTCHLIIKKIGF